MSLLAADIIQAWTTHLAAAYQEGWVTSREMMQAVLFRALQDGGYPPRQVWLSTPLHFQTGAGVAADQLIRFQLQQWLAGRRPALLITEEETVTAVVDLLYSPGEYGDFRQNMRQLMSLYQLRGKTALFLEQDPATGHLSRAVPYFLANDLLCVYGVITRASGLALQPEALVREAPDPGFTEAFLHLGGSISNQQATFFYTMNDLI